MVSFATQSKRHAKYGSTSQLVCILLSAVVLLSCGTRGAGVSDLQVGSQGSGEAFVGHSFSVEANLRANTSIAHVVMDIQPVSGDGWTFNEQYTDGVAGEKGAKFTTEVAVPITAEPGHYRLTLRAVDDNGSATESSTDFELSIDSTVPTLSGIDVGINAAGDDLHLEAELTAPSKIESVNVEVIGDAWNKEFRFTNERLVGQLSYHFHEHVRVSEAPAGTYRVVLTIEDQQGRRAQAEGKFTK
ncbi:DUF4625 domain-containing protein [Parapedobacter deserti]|uniref:DUF4625 domain-containing protein n=1 Tax=Parapedobacter deserti TaxID=1912957 RepID=A0ABV7JJ01_9SPHI